MCLLFAGCSVEEPPPPAPVGPALVPARGVVTLDGKPLEGAIVVFMPTFSGSGTHSVAETGPDGEFSLAHLNRPGTAPGEYRVMVSYMVGESGKRVSLEAHAGISVPTELNTGTELLPPRYSNLSQTELRATVGKDGGELRFELTGPMSSTPGHAATPSAEKPEPPPS